MACDGEIANEEINLVKSLAEKTTLFEGIDVENVLNSFIQEHYCPVKAGKSVFEIVET